jgi:DNA-binding LytR/AlgR family response regulator
MTCIALDDEPLALQLLELFIRQSPALTPLGFFSDPHPAKARLGQGGIDLLFLDIQMPGANGLDFFKKLPKPPLVIFTTAFRQFAVEGFELEAVDYLVKPFDFERFGKAVQRAVEYLHFRNHRASEPGHFFVKSAYRIVKVHFDDLLCVEAFDDYVKLHLHSSPTPLLTLTPLKEIRQMLPNARFMQVHRSFIVALEKVESLRSKQLKVGKIQVPVGGLYLSGVKALFEKK